MSQKKIPTTESHDIPFVFGRINYQIMLLAIGVVCLGFILMIGDTEIYSTLKIVIAPIVVLSGFAIGFFAILKKPSANK